MQTSYFTEEWWEYLTHAIEECHRLGMAFWIHDETYHHSPRFYLYLTIWFIITKTHS